jgi:hypothetical protein
MARVTMAGLITTLRGLANASTADYNIGATAYWSDDQLQDILDRHQFSIREEDLRAFERTATDGTSEWLEYETRWRWLEETDGGTARLFIQDASGSVISSSTYAVNAERGLITFTADQGGSTRALTGYAYDVYAAAADVWRQKSAAYALAIDFTTDNHTVKRSHLSAMADNMAKRYEVMSGTPLDPSAGITIYRGDTW